MTKRDQLLNGLDRWTPPAHKASSCALSRAVVELLLPLAEGA